MTPIETVLAKLPDVKQNGQGWSARCPAHDDHNPSLSIGEGDDGRALVKCHAGCTTDAVLRELDLTMADLMPPKDDHAPSRHIVATYDFTDERGELLYQVVRFDPKDFRQRRSDGNGGWAWSIEGVKRVLYRLPGIVEAGPESFVFIPEGEEDVDYVTFHGQVATTNSGGACKWGLTDDTPLHGRHVVILPDNDDTGRKHAQQVATALHGKAASVRVLELPDLPPKGDVSDWLDAGGDVEELVRLAENAPDWTPDSVPAPIDPVLAGIKFLPASALGEGDQVEWLWHGWLARGFITLLVGLWKAGKSTLLAHALRASAQGGDLGGQIVPCKVLVVAEEGKGLWARRRDDIGIADNVHFVIRPFKGRPKASEWRTFVMDIAERVKTGNYDAVVIDTWQTLNPAHDENDAAVMMAALTPLHHITEAGAGVLLIHHPRKGDGNEGQSSRGSGALPGFVDIIVELRRFDPERSDDTRRVLKGLSRFDETPAEIVLELRGDGYHTVGNKSDAKRDDRMRVIEGILADANEPQDAVAVLAAWTDADIPKPGKRSISNDLNAGLDEGRFTRTGKGAKGDPYRYGFYSGKVQPLSTGDE